MRSIIGNEKVVISLVLLVMVLFPGIILFLPHMFGYQ